MISLPACSYVALIFIHILDCSVSHYFNKTLFLHRQYLAPCEAEVAVSGFQRAQSNPSNYWSGVTFQTTGHVFVGGLPLTYSSYKVRLFQLLDCTGFFCGNAEQIKIFHTLIHTAAVGVIYLNVAVCSGWEAGCAFIWCNVGEPEVVGCKCIVHRYQYAGSNWSNIRDIIHKHQRGYVKSQGEKKDVREMQDMVCVHAIVSHRVYKM